MTGDFHVWIRFHKAPDYGSKPLGGMVNFGKLILFSCLRLSRVKFGLPNKGTPMNNCAKYQHPK